MRMNPSIKNNIFISNDCSKGCLESGLKASIKIIATEAVKMNSALSRQNMNFSSKEGFNVLVTRVKYKCPNVEIPKIILIKMIKMI